MKKLEIETSKKKIMLISFILLLSALVIPMIKAQDQWVCCLKDDRCIDDMLRSDCISQGGIAFPFPCSEVPECKVGVCIPKVTNLALNELFTVDCQYNKHKAECEAANGAFAIETDLCKRGCCKIPNSTLGRVCMNLPLFVCQEIARRSHTTYEFKEGTTDEECYNFCAAEKLGCCVLGNGNCKYETRAECEGTFYEGMYCYEIGSPQCVLEHHAYEACCSPTVVNGKEIKRAICSFDSLGNQEEVLRECPYPESKCMICKEESCKDINGTLVGYGKPYCMDRSCYLEGALGSEELLITDEGVKFIEKEPPKKLLHGQSICYNFFTAHLSESKNLELLRSTGLQSHIIRCDEGRIEVDALGTDRKTLCIQASPVEAKTFTNNWEECRKCAEKSGFWNFIGDVFLPTYLKWISDYCHKDKCESLGKQRVLGKEVQICWFNSDAKRGFGLFSYIGSCDPVYPPGSSSLCKQECGGSNDWLYNVCDENECYALGNCQTKDLSKPQQLMHGLSRFVPAFFATRMSLVPIDCAFEAIVRCGLVALLPGKGQACIAKVYAWCLVDRTKYINPVCWTARIIGDKTSNPAFKQFIGLTGLIITTIPVPIPWWVRLGYGVLSYAITQPFQQQGTQGTTQGGTTHTTSSSIEFDREKMIMLDTIPPEPEKEGKTPEAGPLKESPEGPKGEEKPGKPFCEITVSPSQVKVGEEFNIEVKVSNAEGPPNCNIDGEKLKMQKIPSKDKTAVYATTHTKDKKGTYTITCTGDNYQCEATVTVGMEEAPQTGGWWTVPCLDFLKPKDIPKRGEIKKGFLGGMSWVDLGFTSVAALYAGMFTYSLEPEIACVAEEPLGEDKCELCEMDPYFVCTKERCEVLGHNCVAVPRDDGKGYHCFKADCKDVELAKIESIEVKWYVNPFADAVGSEGTEGNRLEIEQELPWNVTTLWLKIEQDKEAKCRYIIDKYEANFSEMKDFENNEAYPKEQEVLIDVSTLKSGEHFIFIKCRNKCGTVNPAKDDSNFVHFKIAETPEGVPPFIEYRDPETGFISSALRYVNVTIWLSENGRCKYSTIYHNLTTEWNSMTFFDSTQHPEENNSVIFGKCERNKKCRYIDKESCTHCILTLDLTKGYMLIDPEKLISQAEEAGLEINVSAEEINELLQGKKVKIYPFVFRCEDDLGNKNEGDYYSLIAVDPFNITIIKPPVQDPYDRNPEIEVKTTSDGVSRLTHCKYSVLEGMQQMPSLSWNKLLWIDEAFSDVHRGKINKSLEPGTYTLYVKCRDNARVEVANWTYFTILQDTLAPKVIRFYNYNDNYLLIETDEEAECVYGTAEEIKCSYNFSDGSAMTSSDKLKHLAYWQSEKPYYIKCKDRWNNYPGNAADTNKCTIIIHPYEVPKL